MAERDDCAASWWLDSGVSATSRQQAIERIIAMLHEHLADPTIGVDLLCECDDCDPCPCED